MGDEEVADVFGLGLRSAILVDGDLLDDRLLQVWDDVARGVWDGGPGSDERGG